jgi:hypothetical protein
MVLRAQSPMLAGGGTRGVVRVREGVQSSEMGVLSLENTRKPQNHTKRGAGEINTGGIIPHR